VSPNIEQLAPYQPGKPIDEVRRELGLTDVIKLASNENPLGPSPRAIEAIHRCAETVHLYPDGSAHELRQALAAHHGTPPDHLIFGNGSDELLHYLGVTFLNPGDEVIQGDPSFVRYEAAAVLHGAVLHKAPLRNHVHDLQAMADRINARTRMVFIANPNNPTGTIVTEDEVRRFVERVPDRCIVVFDEAYHGYVTSPDYPDTIRYVQEGRNVVVLRTFSKIYGLAGLRVGYGLARPEIVRLIEKVREPFNVNLIAQAAACEALRDTAHLERSARVNRQGKRFLEAAFDELGLTYAPSEANFVWFDVGRSASGVAAGLLRRGVIVRAFNLPGCERFIRVTIGTQEENERFLAALKDVLAGP
jgi:histidinol-phosphate aminotransferase